MEDEDTSAFYAVLNVPRTASTEEVTRAYRRLAQVVHPDKHRDEAKRRQAQESFSKVQEAYEVLSDPLKRQVYDVYGKQGLTAGALAPPARPASRSLRRQCSASPCPMRSTHTRHTRPCPWCAAAATRPGAGLQVGEHLKSREELRREWEEFRTKQQKSQEVRTLTRAAPSPGSDGSAAAERHGTTSGRPTPRRVSVCAGTAAGPGGGAEGELRVPRGRPAAHPARHPGQRAPVQERGGAGAALGGRSGMQRGLRGHGKRPAPRKPLVAAERPRRRLAPGVGAPLPAHTVCTLVCVGRGAERAGGGGGRAQRAVAVWAGRRAARAAAHAPGASAGLWGRLAVRVSTQGTSAVCPGGREHSQAASQPRRCAAAAATQPQQHRRAVAMLRARSRNRRRWRAGRGGGDAGGRQRGVWLQARRLRGAQRDVRAVAAPGPTGRMLPRTSCTRPHSRAGSGPAQPAASGNNAKRHAAAHPPPPTAQAQPLPPTAAAATATCRTTQWMCWGRWACRASCPSPARGASAASPTATAGSTAAGARRPALASRCACPGASTLSPHPPARGCAGVRAWAGKRMARPRHPHPLPAALVCVLRTLQVGCSQNLFDGKADGSVNLVVGPAGASGVATTIARRCAPRPASPRPKPVLPALHARRLPAHPRNVH